MQAAFTRHARRYGIRRLRAELRTEGHAVGRYALRSCAAVADPAAVVAENRLLGQPIPNAPHQEWVGDITYLPLVGGRWCYLATWRDACSRRVVGWQAAQMPTELVLLALEQALTPRQPVPGLIIHADWGANTPAPPAGPASRKPTLLPASAGPVTPRAVSRSPYSSANCVVRVAALFGCRSGTRTTKFALLPLLRTIH
ncbi:DDE-type integrase/transposase/recombinase [Hymenobacter rubidus]|uniref:DDE-type integrase/transposase/recombinase n=1 Tax=Hymenobacter rubidus TaxID=1441626 RepID=UPI00191FDB09